MSKHKQPGGIWTAQYAHCALDKSPVMGIKSKPPQIGNVV